MLLNRASIQPSQARKGLSFAPEALIVDATKLPPRSLSALSRSSEPGGNTILVELDQSRLATVAGRPIDAGAVGDLGDPARADSRTDGDWDRRRIVC
jgi:hypothetical protein